MKADYINPFVKAAIKVLKQFMPDLEVKKGKLSLEEAPFALHGVTVYIGISGLLAGRAVYDMDKETAIKISSAMNGHPLDGLDELARSTISELGNMISGNAVVFLSENLGDEDIDITPPSLIVGSGTELSDSVSRKYLKIPLETNYGTIVISIAVKKRDK